MRLQSFGKTRDSGGSNELLADLKLYKDQKYKEAFAKIQSYHNFYNSQLMFLDLRRLLGTSGHF